MFNWIGTAELISARRTPLSYNLEKGVAEEVAREGYISRVQGLNPNPSSPLKDWALGTEPFCFFTSTAKIASSSISIQSTNMSRHGISQLLQQAETPTAIIETLLKLVNVFEANDVQLLVVGGVAAALCGQQVTLKAGSSSPLWLC